MINKTHLIKNLNNNLYILKDLYLITNIYLLQNQRIIFYKVFTNNIFFLLIVKNLLMLNKINYKK